jgi:hypothetical protein
MMLRRGPIVLLLLVACGGGQASSAAPVDLATTSEGAVRAFLQAVSDSNITRMAHFWGAGNGPAAVTGQPAGYQQRLTVTQLYLRNSPYKILGSDPVNGDQNRVQVNVSFTRSDTDGSTCVRSAPMTVINTGKHGWIVTSLDLTLLGTPGQACKTPKQAN